MAEKIKYTVEKEMIRVIPSGKTSPDSFADIISEISDKFYKVSTRLTVILDARRASFGGKPEDLKVILRRLKENHHKFELIRLAIVLQNPYETAISIILQKMVNDIPNILINVFSTEHAALLWLG